MTALSTAPAAIVFDATKSFGERTVLEGIDVTVAQGEFVALLGASGSGKTTLLRILAGLDAASGGEVYVPAVRTVVFQEPRLVISQRVWRNVVLGLPRAQATRQRATQALAEVGLADHADAWPGTLSGGEAQRVALARALVREPQLLLLDEPFAALDALTRLRMQQLVADLCERHRPGVLLVTHDVDEAVLLADRVLVLTEGRISLDQRIDLPRPRRIGGEAFDALRDRFLLELGVGVAWAWAPATAETEPSEALAQPGVDLAQLGQQGQVPVVVGQVRLDAGDLLGQPLAVLERHELVVAAVPELHRHRDVVEGEPPVLHVDLAVLPPALIARFEAELHGAQQVLVEPAAQRRCVRR